MENHILSVENYDKESQMLKEKTVENEKNQIKTYFSLKKRGLQLHKNRLYIPNTTKIKLTVMDELHKRPYSRHLGYQKMITMIIKDFFCPNMKK